MAYCIEEETGFEGEEGTTDSDLFTLLKNNNLSHLRTKLIDESGLTLDHLLICDKQNLENICNDLNINSIDKIKLITVMKELPNSTINSNIKTNNNQHNISIQEKNIMDNLYIKKQNTSQNIKQTQYLINKFKQNEIDCKQQINFQCDNIISMIEKHRKTLLEQSQKIQCDKEQKLQNILDKMQNRQINILHSISKCQNIINKDCISTSTKLKEMENICKHIETLTAVGILKTENKQMVVINNLNENIFQKHLSDLKFEWCEFDECEEAKTSDGNNLCVPNFDGKWKLIKYENFDTYMENEKYNFVERKVASKLKDKLNVICIVTQKENQITLNTKMTVGIKFKEDTRHGNLKSEWIMDGKTYAKKMRNKYVIEKTCVWSKDKKIAIGTSYDVERNVKRKYKVYLRQDICGTMELCLERVNANNVSMIQIFHKT